jgi:NitT/TauT family transport system ATP-binding protein
MIVLSNVSKSYGERPVLTGFSAEFPAGVTVIMGPSGRGKTTLLRLMMGLDSPDGGAISGVPERLAAVFQEDRLPMDFRAAECVLMTADRDISRKKAWEDLTRLGLGDELGKPVRELSGGQRRRVAAVRAVLARPEALFLDEAFTGLDDAIKKTTADYILENTAGKIVVAVTHDADEAALLGGKILNI